MYFQKHCLSIIITSWNHLLKVGGEMFLFGFWGLGCLCLWLLIPWARWFYFLDQGAAPPGPPLSLEKEIIFLFKIT